MRKYSRSLAHSFFFLELYKETKERFRKFLNHSISMGISRNCALTYVMIGRLIQIAKFKPVPLTLHLILSKTVSICRSLDK